MFDLLRRVLWTGGTTRPSFYMLFYICYVQPLHNDYIFMIHELSWGFIVVANLDVIPYVHYINQY